MLECTFHTDFSKYDLFESVLECEIAVVPNVVISINEFGRDCYYKHVEETRAKLLFYTGLNITIVPMNSPLITVVIRESRNKTIKHRQCHSCVKSRQFVFPCLLPIYMLINMYEEETLLIEDDSQKHAILLKAKQYEYTYKTENKFERVFKNIVTDCY